MESSPSTKRTKYALWCVAFVAVVSVIIFIIYGERIQCHMNKEVFKLTYQFLILVVLGGGISFLYNHYNKVREEKSRFKEKQDHAIKEIRKLQREFYNNFIETYHDVKKIRRFLRARAQTLQTNDGPVMLNTKEYDTLMRDLILVQLKCEFFYEEVCVNDELFKNELDRSKLLKNLENIERYLKKLVSEYEGCYALFPGQHFINDVASIPLDLLPKAQQFIVGFHHSVDYRNNFKNSAKEVTRILLRNLTKFDDQDRNEESGGVASSEC